MNMPYFVEKYKRDIYELQLQYETFSIESSNTRDLILLIKSLLDHRRTLHIIISSYMYK